MTVRASENIFLPRLEALDRSEIEALQSRKLARQLARVYATNPFYRELWDAAGVAPSDIRNRDDIRRLPFTDKQMFLTDQAEHPPFGRRLGVPAADVGEITETSGTSGNAKELHGHTVQDMHLRGQMTALGWAWAGLRQNDSGVFHIPASNSASLYTMLRGIRAVGRLPYLVGHMGFEERLTYMRGLGVGAMYITPSGLNGMSVLMDKLGLKPAEEFPDLRFIMVSAESWPIEWVVRMQDLWQTKISEVYGSTQLNAAYGAACCAGGAVVGGKRGSQHLFEFTNLYEVVDPETGEPVAPGGTGELVITHLDKQASPLVRFRSRDRVTWHPYRRCACGREYDVIEAGVIGRVDDMLKVKGQSIWPSELESLIFAHPEVLEFQARVYISEKGRDEIEVRVAVRDDVDPTAVDRLHVALRRELKAASDVTFGVHGARIDELPNFTSPDKKARRWSDDRHSGLAGSAD
jgi:phenylacetate-CoA ligase